jgi:hypothetical protein
MAGLWYENPINGVSINQPSPFMARRWEFVLICVIFMKEKKLVEEIKELREKISATWRLL